MTHIASERSLDELYQILIETALRNVALSAACSALLAELSLRSDDPTGMPTEIMSSAMDLVDFHDEYIGFEGETPGQREIHDICKAANEIIAARRHLQS